MNTTIKRPRRRGRPPMDQDPDLRIRNKEWLFAFLRGEFTIRELARKARMSERQVKRGIESAVSYPEVHESTRRLAWARGLTNCGGSFLQPTD